MPDNVRRWRPPSYQAELNPMKRHLLAYASLLLLQACSDPTHSVLPPIDGGGFGDGGFVYHDDLGDGGSVGDGGMVGDGGLEDGPALNLDLKSDPGGPTVQILQPMAKGEVSGDTLMVAAKVTAA